MHCCTFVRPDFSKQISRLVQVTLESKDFSVGFKFHTLSKLFLIWPIWPNGTEIVKACQSLAIIDFRHLFLTKLFRHDSSGAESKFTSSLISWLPVMEKNHEAGVPTNIAYRNIKKHTKKLKNTNLHICYESNIQIHPNYPQHNESIESSHMLSSGSQGRLPTALTEWSRKRAQPETPQRLNPQWEENSVNIRFNECR